MSSPAVHEHEAIATIAAPMIDLAALDAMPYLNEGWDAEGGRLRFLRSADDLEDYVAEATPFGGTMLAFRRSDTSFHGHKPYVGVRRMIQMNWVQQSPLERCEKRLNRMTKPVRRLLNVS